MFVCTIWQVKKLCFPQEHYKKKPLELYMSEPSIQLFAEKCAISTLSQDLFGKIAQIYKSIHFDTRENISQGFLCLWTAVFVIS